MHRIYLAKMMCKLKNLIDSINVFRFHCYLNTIIAFAPDAASTDPVDAVDALLIQNAENIFNYEIDKVIMNAKHLIDFSNLLKVTVPAGSDCLLHYFRTQTKWAIERDETKAD